MAQLVGNDSSSKSMMIPSGPRQKLGLTGVFLPSCFDHVLVSPDGPEWKWDGVAVLGVTL